MRAHIPDEPAPDSPPEREPERVPWHDPGPPVRKIDLPPDSPTKGVPIESPPAIPETPGPDRDQ
jgi:hypothetical protein